MRLAAYAGVCFRTCICLGPHADTAQASTVLAAGVVLKAFHERPNFYSTLR